MIEATHFRLQNLINILIEAEETITGGNFPRSTLLTTGQKKKLNEFYGKEHQKWELIYKGSRDGFDSNAFHTRCNNQGPTMTIVLSNNNHLFGGYTSVAWTSSGSYGNDAQAFLFTLTNPHDIPCTKYLVKPGNVGYAAYHNSGNGPTFGSGHDLYIVSNCHSSNSSINFPSGYNDTTGKGSATFTGGSNFLTSDIEVFKQV
jgi:hypothetical protein